ncbi:dihydrodipicolinate reductase, family protein [Mycolicibacterium hassiacum DSM 44199]|uniref:Dihydrodipicolinate reductase, family protein n=1 Tax=Mycolicibacterium hassiacum (strain DSM 44199 / CIP 105218 / JCM 12690 / 3849) TaxID=1122247 RepID=K5BFT5_MYCHD|nr:dihydrodipicolinate reductase, family protein [Mycolicibacterium hassiacum]EKF23426.1 dihydrodipicolinate reductase, family protein [Mycolicibacterium hassiacum DSM 44199]MDA4087702.1 hypothetical protein [Mycolicibacterium hassiacum DSM 44199]VCT88378.1 2,4-diaminopentanoate dehydrogenase [Mycolicibacterium hassiacum DSM 44199]
MSLRVIQWATGAVGSAQLRGIIDRPDLELAGVFVYSPQKAGVDAGELVGRPPTGVRATTDKNEILATDADLVLHAASKAGGNDTNLDDIVALLASGKNVITTTTTTCPAGRPRSASASPPPAGRAIPGSSPPGSIPG